MTQPTPSGLWLMLAILMAVGAMTTAVVLLSSKMPWLPTALAVTLAYGTFGTLPPVTFHLELPSYPDWLQPVLFVPSLNILAVVTGAAVAAAGWGWRSHLRRPDTT